MRKSFCNDNHLQVVFTDEGVSFYGNAQEIYYPYGSLDTLRMSLLGVLQASGRAKICCFVVDRKDRAEMREALKFARKAMAKAPMAEPKIFMKNLLVSSDLPAEEQLKKYKTLFVQGTITRDEYEMRKRQLKDE